MVLTMRQPGVTAGGVGRRQALKSARAAAAGLFAALTLGGCGQGTEAPTSKDLPTYTIVGKEGRLIPEELRVSAGWRFKIIVRNEGSDAIEFESLSLRKEKVLAPGAQSFVVIAPLKPGEYDMFDEFHPATGRGRIVAR